MWVKVWYRSVTRWRSVFETEIVLFFRRVKIHDYFMSARLPQRSFCRTSTGTKTMLCVFFLAAIAFCVQSVSDSPNNGTAIPISVGDTRDGGSSNVEIGTTAAAGVTR